MPSLQHDRRAYWIARMRAGFPEQFMDDVEFRGAIEASAACFAEAEICCAATPQRAFALIAQAHEHARYCVEFGPRLRAAELSNLTEYRVSLKERRHDRH